MALGKVSLTSLMGARGTSLKRLGSWTVAAIGLFALQQVSIAALPQNGVSDVVRRSVLLTATLVLVLLALQLRRLAGAWIVAFGVLLNFLPMAAHGGLMPIAFEVVEASGNFPAVTAESVGQSVGRSKDIVLLRKDIRFEWLADRYAIDVPGYHPNVYSLGDLILFVGLMVAATECLIGAVVPGVGIGLSPRESERDRRAQPKFMAR